MASISWTGGGNDNLWSTAANWSSAPNLPGPTDDVVIGSGFQTINFSSGSSAINSLQSSSPLTISGGTLTVSKTVEVDSTFDISGGTLQGAKVQTGTGTATLSLSGGTLDGVTLASNASLESGDTLTVLDGLTLNGALTVGTDSAVMLQGAYNTTNTLAVNGSASFATGDTVTLDASESFSTTQIVVAAAGTGTLTATGTSFVENGTNTNLTVNLGGKLTASGDKFALGALSLNNVVNAGDLVNNNFNLPLFLPASNVAALSGPGGVSDNPGFQSINILPGTLTSGALNLDAIGGTPNTQPTYVFYAPPGAGGPTIVTGFTVAAGAALNVAPDLSVVLRGAYNTINTLSVLGSANFATGDTVTLDASESFSTTQIVVAAAGTGTLDATGTSFVENGTNTNLTVNLGGTLTASADKFALGALSLNNVVNAGDLVNNNFNLPLFLPASNVAALSGPGGVSDNPSFQSINILPGTLTSGALNLDAIGGTPNTQPTYVFYAPPGSGGPTIVTGFTVAAGATLNVAPNLSVVLQGAYNTTNTLSVQGSANFAAGDTVTLDASESFSTTQIVVAAAGTGTLTATGTSFVENGTNTNLTVNLGGKLTASGDKFALGSLSLNNVVNAGDLINNNFDLPLFLPASNVAALSGPGGISDNPSFQRINILPGTLTSGALNLDAIGGTPNTQPTYVFYAPPGSGGPTIVTGFTVAAGATLNVAPNLSVVLQGAYNTTNTLVVNGSASFATGDTVTLDASESFSTTQIVVAAAGTGTLTATGTSFVDNGTNTNLTVNLGGKLTASADKFALGALSLNNVVNAGDLVNNNFNLPLFLPASNVAALSGPGGVSDNLSFQNINILPGTLASGALNLDAIGGTPNTQPTYVFYAPPWSGGPPIVTGFTVAAGAILNVAPDLSVVLPGAYNTSNTLSVQGSASFASGDTVRMDASESFSTAQIVVTGTLIATQTTFGQTGGNAGLVLSNGNFLALGSAVSVGTISINGTGQFSISPTTTLNATGNLLGTPQTPSAFTPNGVMDLSGAGTSSSPQILQAMSADKGINGFLNNYAYTSIALGNTTYVKLQGTAGEAIYTNSIDIPKGTTLDLNGVHLYAHDVENDGTVTDSSNPNNAIILVTGGGQIAVGSTVAGDISAIGNVDTWTFNGLSGDKVTVSLDPGSGTAGGPIGTPLGWAKVTLLDSSNNVLATATDSSINTPLILPNVLLPANDTYTIQVQAAPAEASSVGNYVLGLSDVESSVGGLPGTTTSLSFPVTWSGGDGAGEYPIAQYDIYVSDNGGPFTPWLTATTLTTANYVGVNGHTYGFYSVATDAAGNRQPAPTAAEATTTIALATPTVTWNNPADITYGIALGAKQLDATASVPGTFWYTLADGTTWADDAVLPAGANQTLNVTFTPTDTNDYTVVKAQVAINVDRATLTVKADDVSKVFGTANPTLTDTISGFVNGEGPSVVSGAASLTTAADIASPVGSYTIAAALGTLSAANYDFSFQSGTLNVTLATPVIAWTKPADITYGAALGVGQLDATASVPGTFSYTLADATTSALGAVLNAGLKQTLNVIFTPTDAKDYPSATAQVQINVDPAALTVKADDATRPYGVANPSFTDTISGFVNGDGLSVVSGAAGLATSATPSSGPGTYAITAAQGTLSAANYSFTFANGTLTVTQATPVVTWSDPADIVYGTALSGTQLDATASVAGTFSYTLADGKTAADDAVLHVGPNQMLNVTFTPTDTVDFSTVTGLVAIDVAPAVLTVTVNDATRDFGAADPVFTDTISGFVNGDTASVVSGAASLTTTATSTSIVGGYTIAAALGTLSAVDYDFIFVSATLTVIQATPVPVWNDPATIVYGQALGIAQLDATDSVGGTFTYTLADGKTPALGAVLDAGRNQTLNVIFTPTDTVDYTTATFQVTIDVDPAILTVAVADATRVFGAANPIFSDTISGFVNGDSLSVVSGAASLTSIATTTSIVGDYAIAAALGTLSAANYTFIFQSSTLTVARATPVLTWNSPADIIYGAALGATQLDASASVAGTFSYTLADGKTAATGAVLSAGPNQTLNVLFTPTDAIDYLAVMEQVPITVDRATLTVKANDASRSYGAASPIFGDTISGFVNGDSMSVVSGAASLSTSATITSIVGDYSITAALGTLSAANYTFVFESATLIVTQATPSIAWGSPAGIVYGAALGVAQLDATANVAGSFSYTLADGTTVALGAVLPAGLSQTLNVIFTPTDTIDYVSTTARVQIDVAPATLTVKAADGSRAYSAANPIFGDTISGFVNGDTLSVVSGAASLTSVATTVSTVGNYTIAAALGTLNAANYTFVFQNATLTVTQATPVLTWSSPADIVYGAALGATQLDASANTAGVFTYTLADGTTSANDAVLVAGPNQDLIVSFKPTDAIDYLSTTAQVPITVDRATLNVKADDASRIYGTANPTFTDTISGFVNGDGPSAVSGAANLTTTANISSPVGSYTIAAAQGTLTATNYDFAFQNGTLSVTLATPSIAWSNPADLTYGQPLGVGQLDATANVPGTFSYTLADGKTSAIGAVLNAGPSQTLNAIFTPTDMTDYAAATAQVAINVDRAVLMVAANDASRPFGAANPNFTDTIAGFVNGDTPSVVSGAASLTTTADAASPVGNYTIVAASGSLSATNYDFTFQNATLAVTKTAPKVTWSDPADVVYGSALGAAQLDATANVPGTFIYTLADGKTSANGAVLQVGAKQTLLAIFTPTDANDYTPVTAQAAITVDPATLTVMANDASKVYDTANPTFTDTISGFVNGDGPGVVSGAASLTTTANIASPVGSYAIAVAQGTMTASNYDFAFQNGTLSVTLATPVITWSNPADITYSQPLGVGQLDATASVPGTFSYTLADGKTPAIGAVLHAGQNQALNVIFSPTDATDYPTATDHVEINVKPATLTVTANDASRAYGAPDPAFTDTITGFVNGDTASDVSGAASLTSTATTTSPIGSYPITAAQGTLRDPDYDFSFQNGVLTVTKATLSFTASVAGDYAVKISSGTIEILDSTNQVVAQSPLVDTAAIVFTNASPGAVTLTVDYSGGDPLPSGGLDFAGGGSDTLGVTGYATTTITETFTGPHSGLVQVGSGAPISYSGLSPVLIQGGTANDIVFNLPAGTVGASLQDDGVPGNKTVELTSTNGTFESTTFAVPTNSLTVNAGSGTDSITTTADFSGDFNAGLSIDGTAATDTVTLDALNLTQGTGALSVTAKTIDVNGNITTTGAQNYNDAVTLTADATLNSGAIAFAGTVNSDATPRALTIDGGVTFNGAVGDTKPLNSLSVNGAADVEGGAVTTVATQNYSGNVTLSADTALIDASNAPGAIVFGGTLGSDATATPRKLTITGGATFVGVIGATHPLESLTVAGQSKMEEATAYIVTSVYDNPVTLTVDTTLYGSVTFNATVDSASDNAAVALTINALTGFASTEAFDAPVGQSHVLKALTVNAPANFASAPNGATVGGLVITEQTQTYGGPTTFVDDAALTTTQGGDIDFNDSLALGNAATANLASNVGNVNFQGTVDGASALTVATTGMTTFNADIGDTTPPTSIHVTGATTFGKAANNALTMSHPLNAAGLAPLAAAAAPITLAANVVGLQKYDGLVFVDKGSTVSSLTGDIVFGSNIESPNGSDLGVFAFNGKTLTATGVVRFDGAVGDSGPLGTVTVETGGPFILSVDVTTTGGITIAVPPSALPSPANFQLAAGAELKSTGPQGSVKLSAFNDVLIDSGASVVVPNAAASIFVDFNSNKFYNSGAKLDVNGTIDAQSVSLEGGAGDSMYIDDPKGTSGSDTQQTLTGYGFTTQVNYTGVRPAVVTPLTLPTIVSDAGNNAGEAIGALLASSPVDQNDLPPGIAVTGLDEGNPADGAWQFSTDGGATWSDIGLPSDSNALLLGASDRVRFAPDANFTGNSGFTFRAWDGKTGTDGGVSATNDGAAAGFSAATETASITVDPVPGTPSFVAGVNPKVVESGGPQTVPGWATNIDPGQIAGHPVPTLNFLVSTDDNALFAVAPAIDPSTGTLTYTPAVGVLGTAKVTVQLMNDGGAVHGGHDSAPQVFTITVQRPGGTYVIGSGTVQVSAGSGVLLGSGATSGYSVTSGDVTGSQGGTFSFRADGSFTYTPGANNPGYDSTQVAVTDANGDKLMAPVTVLSQHAAVVYKFYEAVLGRTPDLAGLQYWTNYFDNGGQTGQMAVGFFESDELLDEVLGSYYQQFLLRPLDPAGLTYWKSVWHATGGPEKIKAGFADSPEFYASAGATPDAWITALYQRVLNRPADPSGKSYWLNDYQQQTAAGVDAGTVRYDIALGFFDSPEAYANDVAGWFDEYLFRPPSNSETSQFVGQMKGGASDRTIEQNITNSQEYANNPAAPATGAAAALLDYYQTSPTSDALVAAKDAFFSSL